MAMVVFKWLLVLFIMKPFYDFPERLLGVVVTPYFQYINLILVLIVSLFMLDKKMKITFMSGVFVFFALVGMVVFFVNENPGAKVFSHVYFYVMPAIMITYGVWLARRYMFCLERYVIQVANIFFPFAVSMSVAYLVAHHTGYWDYFGFSGGILLSYVLGDKNKTKLISGLLLDMASGKRTVLLLWISVLIKSNFKHFSVLLLFVVFLIYVLPEAFIPGRYLSVLNVDLIDDGSLYLATGGRSAEWFALFQSMTFWDYIIGKGFGFQYVSYDALNNENYDVRHYSHMMPLSYLAITGIFSLFFIYGGFVYYFVKSWKQKNVFSYFFILVFVSSFAGASLFVEPFIWVMFGILHVVSSRSLLLEQTPGHLRV